jgi:hypothetical protein
MKKSYMCHTCDTEYDTVTKAAACTQRHEEETASLEINPIGLARPAVPLPRAPELLGRAATHMHERGKTYDEPEGERSMGKAVTAFNAITGRTITESEGWLLLQVLKDVRLFTRAAYHQDSAEDCIAYAALKAEAKGDGR